MDYSSMKAQKTKTKYHYDADISVSRNEKKKLKKAAKKLNWILALVFLVIGFAGSFCLVKFGFAGDKFVMVAGTDNQIDMYIGKSEFYQTYEEFGVEVVSFGKDYSKEYKVEYYYRYELTDEKQKVDKVDENKPGIYYAVYTTNASRYKSVTLIRNIIVLGGEDDV